MRAAIVASVIGMLGNTDYIKNIFTPSARVGRRASASYPRQSDREKLRRRIGGFAKLHDHTMIYPDGKPVRLFQCPICDLGMSHAKSVEVMPCR